MQHSLIDFAEYEITCNVRSAHETIYTEMEFGTDRSIATEP